MLSQAERSYLEAGRVARLATADAAGRPSVVPICYACTAGSRIVTPIDEKPKSVDPTDLRRIRDIEANPAVALVVDHYRADWDRLGWVQIRGSADLLDPTDVGHSDAVDALLAKYDQYTDHDLGGRPVITIEIGSVRSWGTLTPEAV